MLSSSTIIHTHIIHTSTHTYTHTDTHTHACTLTKYSGKIKLLCNNHVFTYNIPLAQTSFFSWPVVSTVSVYVPLPLLFGVWLPSFAGSACWTLRNGNMLPHFFRGMLCVLLYSQSLSAFITSVFRVTEVSHSHTHGHPLLFLCQHYQHRISTDTPYHSIRRQGWK